MKVKAKRSYCNYLLPYKSSPSCRPKTAVITKENLQPEKLEEKQADDIENNDNIYIFHPGMVPPSRQMFYQVLYIQSGHQRGARIAQSVSWLGFGLHDLHNVQTGPGTHPAALFMGWDGQNRHVTIHLQPGLRLSMSGARSLLSLYAFMAWTGTTLFFTTLWLCLRSWPTCPYLGPLLQFSVIPLRSTGLIMQVRLWSVHILYSSLCTISCHVAMWDYYLSYWVLYLIKVK